MNLKTKASPTKIFLGSLPGTTKDFHIHKAFKPFGKVADINLVMNLKKKRCKGYGHLAIHLSCSLDHLISSNITILNRKINCEQYFEGNQRTEHRIAKARRRIHISDIPPKTSNKELENFFNQFGEVESAFGLDGPSSDMKIGYVTFKSLEDTKLMILKRKILFKGFWMELSPYWKSRDKEGKPRPEGHSWPPKNPDLATLPVIRYQKIPNHNTSCEYGSFRGQKLTNLFDLLLSPATPGISNDYYQKDRGLKNNYQKALPKVDSSLRSEYQAVEAVKKSSIKTKETKKNFLREKIALKNKNSILIKRKISESQKPKFDITKWTDLEKDENFSFFETFDNSPKLELEISVPKSENSNQSQFSLFKEPKEIKIQFGSGCFSPKASSSFCLSQEENFNSERLTNLVSQNHQSPNLYFKVLSSKNRIA